MKNVGNGQPSEGGGSKAFFIAHVNQHVKTLPRRRTLSGLEVRVKGAMKNASASAAPSRG